MLIDQKTKPIVIILEDDADIAGVMADILNRESYETYHVRSFDGYQAWCATHAPRLPDIILLDLSLPGITGQEIFAKLKRDPATELIPVIVVTANDQVAMRVQMLNQGVSDYITKPFEFKELLQRVAVHVKIGRLRQQNDYLQRSVSNYQTRIAKVLQISTALPADASWQDRARHLLDALLDTFDFQTVALFVPNSQQDQLQLLYKAGLGFVPSQLDPKSFSTADRAQISFDEEAGYISIQAQDDFTLGTLMVKGIDRSALDDEWPLRFVAAQLAAVVGGSEAMAEAVEKPRKPDVQPIPPPASITNTAELQRSLELISTLIESARHVDNDTTQFSSYMAMVQQELSKAVDLLQKSA